MQNNIKNEFIPYEQALALKELGFDEPCFKKYIAGCLWSSPTTNETYQKIHPNSSDSLAPLYQQAFRWFDEHTECQGFVVPSIKEGHFDWCIIDENTTIECEEYYVERIEAELACLKKLIEIVKSQNNAK